MLKHFNVLYFEDFGIHFTPNDQDKNVNIKTDITIALLSIQCIILFICIFQLLRFFNYAKLYLKKVMHFLVALQMIVGILQVINIPDPWEELLDETTFVFSSLTYCAVLLFWFDFHHKLKQGKGIAFLQTRAFLICTASYVILYIGSFAFALLLLSKEEAMKLPSYIIWWHLAFYTCAMMAALTITIIIANTTMGLYFTVRIRFFKKTAKILAVVCCCFIIRFLGALLFAFIHHKRSAVPHGWDTPLGFAIIYMFDRIIPVVIFMILMRKLPSVTHPNASLSNLYAPLLNDA